MEFVKLMIYVKKPFRAAQNVLRTAPYRKQLKHLTISILVKNDKVIMLDLLKKEEAHELL
jgi:hypothetical protein